MLGAIIGDIVGSVHEFEGTKTKHFPLFVSGSTYTDDSVLTVAVAEWLLTGSDLTDLLHGYFRSFPWRGYGGRFLAWAHAGWREPYNSLGNGSAMRVSPVGFAFDRLDEVLTWAEESAAVTHNHPEGIRGAQATAAAILFARQQLDKAEIRERLESRFGYELGVPLDEIRPGYQFDETCPGTVPQALRAFLEGTSYEDTIRNAISLGGDADTLACIAGSIAEAYYGVPDEIVAEARPRIDDGLMTVVERFREVHGLAAGVTPRREG